LFRHELSLGPTSDPSKRHIIAALTAAMPWPIAPYVTVETYATGAFQVVYNAGTKEAL